MGGGCEARRGGVGGGIYSLGRRGFEATGLPAPGLYPAPPPTSPPGGPGHRWEPAVGGRDEDMTQIPGRAGGRVRSHQVGIFICFFSPHHRPLFLFFFSFSPFTSSPLLWAPIGLLVLNRWIKYYYYHFLGEFLF